MKLTGSALRLKSKGKWKLPPKYHEEVLTLVGEGMTHPDVVLYLKEKYDLDINYQTIGRIVRNRRKLFQRTAKDIYAKEVSKAAQRDMQILSENTDILVAMRDEAYQSNNHKLVLDTCKQLESLISTKIKHLGDENDSKDSEAKDEFIEKLISESN